MEEKLKSKIPIWERKDYLEGELFNPKDRNYFKSSYAIDKKDNERRLEQYGELKNQEDIIVGEIYKFSQLKRITKEEFNEKSTNSREHFKKKISCYFEIEELPRKGIYIKSKREEPIAPLTKREEREFKSKYNDYIYKILLMMLYNPKEDENDFYEFVTNRWNLYKILGFANSKFFDNYSFKNNKENKEFKMNYIESQFYKDAFSMFSDTLHQALVSLHRKKKINYYWETYVKTKGSWRMATRTESLYITQIEGEVLSKYQCESVYQAILKGVIEEYKDEVKSKLQKVYDIEEYKEEIDIWVIKSTVEYGILKETNKYIGKTIEERCVKALCDNAYSLNGVIKERFLSIADKGSSEYSDYRLSKQLKSFGRSTKEDIKRKEVLKKEIEKDWETNRKKYIEEFITLKEYFKNSSKIIPYKSGNIKESDMKHNCPQLI